MPDHSVPSFGAQSSGPSLTLGRARPELTPLGYESGPGSTICVPSSARIWPDRLATCRNGRLRPNSADVAGQSWPLIGAKSGPNMRPNSGGVGPISANFGTSRSYGVNISTWKGSSRGLSTSEFLRRTSSPDHASDKLVRRRKDGQSGTLPPCNHTANSGTRRFGSPRRSARHALHLAKIGAKRGISGAHRTENARPGSDLDDVERVLCRIRIWGLGVRNMAAWGVRSRTLCVSCNRTRSSKALPKEYLPSGPHLKKSLVTNPLNEPPRLGKLLHVTPSRIQGAVCRVGYARLLSRRSKTIIVPPPRLATICCTRARCGPRQIWPFASQVWSKIGATSTDFGPMLVDPNPLWGAVGRTPGQIRWSSRRCWPKTGRLWWIPGEVSPLVEVGRNLADPGPDLAEARRSRPIGRSRPSSPSQIGGGGPKVSHRCAPSARIRLASARIWSNLEDVDRILHSKHLRGLQELLGQRNIAPTRRAANSRSDVPTFARPLEKRAPRIGRRGGASGRELLDNWRADALRAVMPMARVATTVDHPRRERRRWTKEACARCGCRLKACGALRQP